MRLVSPLVLVGLLVILGTLGLSSSAVAIDKMPAAKAGTIGSQTGQIAFVRDKNIWVMDAHGGHQHVVCEVGNADGRLSWSPDNKKIAFTRSGQATVQGPDNLGGKHKLYDIFVVILDSANNSNTMWWNRLTNELGARDPEWQPDGTILFYRDLNARMVDAFLPNYQVCTMDSLGDRQEILRKDWQNMNEYLTNPSMSPDGHIAAIHIEKPSGGSLRPRGIAILDRNHFMISLDSIRVLSGLLENYVSPAFSPDGKWLAYYGNSMSDPSLYISSADLKEQYLVFSPPPGTTLQSFAPSFSPDSKWLTFATRDGSIWVCDITGNQAQRLSGPGMDASPAWSKATK